MKATGLEYTYVWLWLTLFKIKQRGVLGCVCEIFFLPEKYNKFTFSQSQIARSHRGTE